MKLNWSQIFQGWRNELLPPEKIKEFLEQLSAERLSLCIDCPANSTPGKIGMTSRCTECDCWLRPKSKCTDCSCPIAKWGAVLSPEQDDELQEAIKN